MSANVRRAKQEEMQVLEKLFEEFSQWPLDRLASINRAINDPNGELLVAEVDHQIVGFIHQVFYEDPLHGGQNSIITDLFVKQLYRGKRIGSQMLKKALKSAKRRKVKEVHVSTRENNKNAMEFYEKHGFCRAGPLFEKDLE